MLRVTNLTAAYEGKPIFTDLSVTFKPGAITGIIGPNGAGKSTLIKNMIGLRRPLSGQATYNETDLLQNKQLIAYIEQRADLDLTFPVDVLDVVMMGTYPQLGWFKVPSAPQKQAARAALTQVGLQGYGPRQIGQLSGGQLQRVFVARAIVQNAPIVFLDEPFVGIDMNSEAAIMTILKAWRDAGKTIVVVHHDLNKVTTYFDELIIFGQTEGIVAAGPVQETFTKANIEKAFSPDLSDVLFTGVSS